MGTYNIVPAPQPVPAAGFESAEASAGSAASPFWHFWHLSNRQHCRHLRSVRSNCSVSRGGCGSRRDRPSDERQPHRERRRWHRITCTTDEAPGRPEVIAVDEVAAEGLARAGTLKMASVDPTERAAGTQSSAAGAAGGNRTSRQTGRAALVGCNGSFGDIPLDYNADDTAPENLSRQLWPWSDCDHVHRRAIRARGLRQGFPWGKRAEKRGCPRERAVIGSISMPCHGQDEQPKQDEKAPARHGTHAAPKPPRMAPASVSKTVAVSAMNPLAPDMSLEVLQSHWNAAADSAAATTAPRIAAAATLICVSPMSWFA